MPLYTPKTIGKPPAPNYYGQGRPASPVRVALEKLKIGQCFDAPFNKLPTARAVSVQRGIVITTRSFRQRGSKFVRIWRVA